MITVLSRFCDLCENKWSWEVAKHRIILDLQCPLLEPGFQMSCVLQKSRRKQEGLVAAIS